MVKAITFNNGTENALHLEIGKALGIKTYFCKPGHTVAYATPKVARRQ